ncbi:hypothetical protein ABFA07_002943 [Porites harrisoni]
MSGILKKVGILLTVLLLVANCSPAGKSSPYCKLDKTVRDLIWHLLPLSVRLGGNVYSSYNNISSKWLTPDDQWRIAAFPFSVIARPLNSTGLTKTQGLLLSDQSILSSFLPLIKASAADFQRFANGSTAAQHLRNLENELQSMIALLRRLQAIFNIQTKTTANVSTVTVTSGNQLPLGMPTRTSQVTVHNSTRSLHSTLGTPTIHRVALRVSVILNDLYTSLLQMDVDFNNMRRVDCSKI